MQNKTNIKNYQPNERAKKVVRSMRIVLLVGISGAGKNTIKQALLASGKYAPIISHTTRAPRTNEGMPEQHGREYFFTSDADMRDMAARGEFVEVKEVHNGTLYGTSIAGLESIADSGKVAIADVDIQGVDEYKRIAHEVIAIFLVPPSFDEWMRRVKFRYQGDEQRFAQEWPRRYQTAINELEHALSRPYYHFIVNDDIARVSRVIDEIAERGDTYHRKDDEVRLYVRQLLEKLKATAPISEI